MKALALLSTLQSAGILLPATDGRKIRMRRVNEPTVEWCNRNLSFARSA